MIGLSVAVGRFVEALFWAILRVAGTVTAAALAGVLVLVVAIALLRRVWRKRKSSPARGGGGRVARDGGVTPFKGGTPLHHPATPGGPPPLAGED